MSIMIPSYMVKVERRNISQADHRKPTAIWLTTLSPILTVFDMILIAVLEKVVRRVIVEVDRLKDTS